MTEINMPDYLPSWIKEHIGVYLEDGEAGHLWDASLGVGRPMMCIMIKSKVSTEV